VMTALTDEDSDVSETVMSASTMTQQVVANTVLKSEKMLEKNVGKHMDTHDDYIDVDTVKNELIMTATLIISVSMNEDGAMVIH